MDKRTSLVTLGVGLAALTFVTSMAQWLVGRIVSSSQYNSLLSSMLIVCCIALWDRNTRSLPWLPTSSFWKTLCYSVSVIVFMLLMINSLNPTIARITGQVRSLSEVVDVIIFGPLAEELVFRDAMWSIFKKLVQNSHRPIVILMGTSVLFGVGHLGYWALSSWLLPSEAMMHALLMVGAGACFGGFRLVSRSLLVPIVVHMLANGVILLTQ